MDIKLPQANRRLVDFGNNYGSPTDFMYIFWTAAEQADVDAMRLRMDMTRDIDRPTRVFDYKFVWDSSSAVPLKRWTHLVVTVGTPDGSGTSTARAYKNGLLVWTGSYIAIAAIPRSFFFLGRSGFVDDSAAVLVNATYGAFRVWQKQLSHDQVRLSFSSAQRPVATQGDDSPLVEYLFENCAKSNVDRAARDSGSWNYDGLLVGDVSCVSYALEKPAASVPAPAAPAAPPAPTLQTALATSPTTILVTVNFTAGEGITLLAAACDGPSGPYVGSLSVSDADAAGAPISVTVELSYGGQYTVNCSVRARRQASGPSSLPSTSTNVTIPAGNSIAAQSALMPSGNTGASNAFWRVGQAVESEESVQIVFAAKVANYLVGQRPAAHRLGLITRSKDDYTYCDFDLDSNRCSFVMSLSQVLGDAKPTEFAYTSMSPWPAKDPDARFSPANLTAFQSDWPWSAEAFAGAADLVGAAVADVLRPPASCAGFGCYSYAAQRWMAYVYSGCTPVPYGATNCLDFFDAEPSERSFEGGETAADVRRAYPSAAPFEALLLQELRYASFWSRGVAFFGSFAALGGDGGPSSSVLPLIKACSLPTGVALLAFDLASIAPAGYGAAAGGVYKSVPWPQEGGAFFADAFPPGASLQAIAADGRVEAGGPLLYHALVRIPFFPNASLAACPAPLVSGICGARSVAHVVALFTWRVDAAAFSEAPTGIRLHNASLPAPATYRTAVFTHTPPRVLRTEVVALADHWIIQNERPLHAGPGYGYLEGRWVDPPDGRYAFYVTGDRVVRVRKANAYQSGLAGTVIDGEVRIYGEGAWKGTRAAWTSVATAVYKDGTLFVAQELHTQTNTRVFTFASDRETRPRYVHSRRMKRAAERAPGSRLLRLRGVDGAAFELGAAGVRVDLVVASFPANVLSASTVDDFSSGRMFEGDPSLPFAELSWAAVFNRSVAIADLCTPLPAGRYSSEPGLLLDTDAPLCPNGTFSQAGSTECAVCEAGTFSGLGADSCYGPNPARK
eukprot:tig00000737_g3801.t1